MMKILEGKLLAEGMKIGIVAARFNEFIVSKLLSGAEDALIRHGANGDDITVAWVPGAFEIPTAAQKMAKSGKYDAVICLGAVIRGSTSHYDYVCNEVSKGIAQAELNMITDAINRDKVTDEVRAMARKQRFSPFLMRLLCGCAFGNFTLSLRLKNVVSVCLAVDEKAALTAMDEMDLRYDLRELTDYDLWLAEYDSKPDFYYHFDLWQYTHTGQVAGIQGDVDLDLDLR